MTRKLLAGFCIFCTLLLVLFVSEIVFAQSASQSLGGSANNTPLITQAIDESNLVVLHGNTHPLALPQYDQGPVSPDFALHRMLLVLRRSPAQEAALDQLLDQQQDNSSPYYHQWLTPQQFGQQFGPTDQDIQTITSWLQSHGFQVTNVSNGRVVIEFSGTAGQVADAFHTTIHNYSVYGEHHIANSTDPQIPAALAPAIAGIESLNGFPRKWHSQLAGPFTRSPSTGKIIDLKPQLTILNAGCGVTGNCYGIGPYDFATIYDMLPLWNAATPIDGTGETIAIVAETDVNPSDFTSFRNFLGISNANGSLNVIHNGPDPGILQDGEETESDLDTQWSGAVAKGATIDFVVSQATETSPGIDLSDEYIVDNNLAGVMSESYGYCELGLGTSGNQYFASLWQQAAAQGISVFISAGDNGSAGCDNFDATPPAPSLFGLQVSGFASTPYNIAVGGTDFNDAMNPQTYWRSTNTSGTQESALGYIPETTWNDTCTNGIFASLGFSTVAETNCNNPELIDFVSTLGGSGGVSGCTTPSGTTASSCSGGYPKPSWQTGAGLSSGGNREIPDVSLFAAIASPSGAGYILCEADALNGASSCDPTNPNTEFFLVGGTSGSSPSFAGIMALINQKSGGRQGNANYVFYKMAASTGGSCNSSTVSSTGSNSCIFYDVTNGTNQMPCATGSNPNCKTSTNGDQYGVLTGYATTAGFDEATGLGSVNVTNLVNQWGTFVGQFKPTKFSTFSLTPSPVTHGQAVTVAATVVPQTAGAGTPSGTITLIANAGAANQQAAQQIFTLNSSGSLPTGTTTIFLPGGSSESITAHYSGDSTFAPSDSSPFTVTVNPEPSKSTVQVETYNASTGQITNSNATNFVYGTPTFLRANVFNASGNPCAPNDIQQYGCPTGSVALNDTFNPGTGTTTSPIAGSPYALNSEGYTEDGSLFLLGGTHSIVASYSGDNSFLSSTGTGSSATPDAIIVTPAPTSISASNVGTVLVNEGATLYATLSVNGVTLPNPPPSSYLPSQNVQFYDGSTLLSGTTSYTTNYSESTGIVTIYADLNTTFQAVGNHTITAKFPGDSNYSASGPSNSVTVDVQIPTTLAITSSNPSVQVATPVTFTATVTPTQTYSQSMTGTVTFTGGPNETVLGTVNIANNQAQFTTSSLPAGSYAVYAQYSGDTNYAAAGSGVGETVIAISTTTSITASSTTVSQGTNVTLTATVTPSQTLSTAPTGTVEFLWSDVGARVSLVNNQGQYMISSLPLGSNLITATYSGDSNYSGSTSASVTVTVTAPPTFTISANPSPMVVSAPGANGSSTLTFTSMNSYAGSIPLSSSLFSGLPSETTCSFNVMSVTLTASGAGSTGTATATCQTTAPSSGVAPPLIGKRPAGPGWWLPFGFAAVIAGILALALSPAGAGGRRADRPRRRRVAFALFALAAFVAMSSCGGGSSGPPPPPPNPGTPIGLDNNVMITFSNAGVTPSPTLNLPINVE